MTTTKSFNLFDSNEIGYYRWIKQEPFIHTIMETVTITPNLKLIRFWNGILGSTALLLTCYYIYSYTTGSMPNDWFIYLPLSICITIYGFGRALGYYELSSSHISFENDRLSVSGPDEGDVDLRKLSWIRLNKKRIEYKIQWSGYRGYFKIPWRFRMKSRLVPLKEVLRERCRHHNIEFESEL